MTKTIRRTLLTLAIAAASFTPLVASAQGDPTQDVFRPSASTTADGWRDFGGGYGAFVGQPQGASGGKTRAEVRAELAALRLDMVTHDGWRDFGGGYSVYVGPPQGASGGKTRAEVRAELEAARDNPVGYDGWRDFGGGYSVYAGQPAPADRMVPTAAASRSAAAPR